MTHYETAGPPAGPAVVLVHGFSTPLLVWERTAPALAAAGFHVVAYDLYGRGRSDRLHCAYDPALYERQLRALIETLAISAGRSISWASRWGRRSAPTSPTAIPPGCAGSS